MEMLTTEIKLLHNLMRAGETHQKHLLYLFGDAVAISLRQSAGTPETEIT